MDSSHPAIQTSLEEKRPLFATTSWNVVLVAGGQGTPESMQAWEALCRTYWYPLYAFVRRQGYQQEDAQDLVQEFFSRLLAKDYIARADPDKGRFRSFLLTGIKRLLYDEHDKGGRLKRGGGLAVFSLDAGAAEDRYQLEPPDNQTPEALYERSWATALLEHAADRLRAEYQEAGKGDLFEQLTEFRLDAEDPRTYAEVAARLRLSEGAVKSGIHRLRQRHHQLVREEIGKTLANPSELEEEVCYLRRVLGA